jgi:hypothetical protein
MAGKHRAESEQRGYAQEPGPPAGGGYAPAPPPTPAPARAAAGGIAPEALDRLTQLGQLHDQGVLTDVEFAEQKRKLLGG